MKRFTLLFLLILPSAYSDWTPFQESDGRVIVEAEWLYSATPRSGVEWRAVTEESITNARNRSYAQALPDNNIGIMPFTNGPAADFTFLLTNAGTYRLWLRWTGHDFDSDSIFAGILELADGLGGVPDWYADTDNRSFDFNVVPWDGLGGAEENQPTSSQNPMVWTFPTPGLYTLRVVAREDGVALDSWILQQDTLPDPGSNAPPATRADRVLMHHYSQVGIPVLRNDSFALNPATIALVDTPAFGTAIPQPDGNILYHHTTGAPDHDTFTYRAVDALGHTTLPTRVFVQFTNAPRLPATTVFMPPAPPSAAYHVLDAFPGVTFSAPTSMESPPGDTNRIFVAERGGAIYFIPNIRASFPTRQLFMDLSSRVQNDGNELGLKGIAFHPGFATNRLFYAAYCTFTNGQRFVRLSQFTAAHDLQSASPTTEVWLINQRNDDTVHNINDAVFGPDGYLYLGMGDEGPSNDANNNSQRIDKNIWSAVLRIDPDHRPGNLPPNPHPGIPTNAAGARFSIPADNPFVGATQFNGVAVNPSAVRTEFFAVGLRNPWQFSFDPANGEIWLGDVGQDAREEINVVTAGGNYGWAYYEASLNGPKTPPPGFQWTRPVWEYTRGMGSNQGFSVTGGLVYRGAGYPELYGKYLFADYVSGNIWSLERGEGFTNVVRIAGEGGLVQFAVDPATDEVLMLDHGDGRIRRLVRQISDDLFPQRLSETGIFSALSDLAPNPGVIPYSINLPFWSDYAAKQRWFALPDLDSAIGYAREGAWTYPAGMLWVKHFDLETERGNTGSAIRIETRVLVRTTNGSYGVSYMWDEDGTEAYLVPDAGIAFDIAITNSGPITNQTWAIPSRAQCITCHNPAAGHALSFVTRQLNRDGTLAGLHSNFIALLSQAGYLSNSVDPHLTLPRHVRPDEIEYSVEARARAWLDVNCAYCHQAGSGAAPATWDARAPLTLAETRMLRGPASDNKGNTNNLLIAPGDLVHSVIFNRIAVSNGFSRMPPLATFERDPAGMQIMADWIARLTNRLTYAEWRMLNFGSTNSPAGHPQFDADDDARNNFEEFLAGTDPLSPDRAGFARPLPGGVEIELPDRGVVVDISTNLVDWQRWLRPGNQGIPASGAYQLLGAPDAPETFFRFWIAEP